LAALFFTMLMGKLLFFFVSLSQQLP